MTELLLSPQLRGAADRLDTSVPAFLRSRMNLRIASQQLCDTRVVDAICASLDSNPAKLLLEGDYLRPAARSDTAKSKDDEEPHLSALATLTRRGCAVRQDDRSGLQHMNMILGTDEQGGHLLVSSANLAPGSLTTHFNWAVASSDARLYDPLSAFFDAIWSATPIRATLTERVKLTSDTTVHLSAGIAGEACVQAEEDIAQAKRSIHFAFFNLVKGARVTRALEAAAKRGVEVKGIVDGDQGNLPWDGIPSLRAAGVDGGYYPGALTGAGGRRMHYKMLAIDGRLTHLTTANGSASAEQSLELAVSFATNNPSDLRAAKVAAEITRLRRSATEARLPLMT